MEKKKFRISGKLIFNLAVVAISIYLIIYFFVSEDGLIDLLKKPDGCNMLIILAALLIYDLNILVDAVVTLIYVRSKYENFSFIEALKVAFVGVFFSAITPSSTGGQPMQLYLMSKKNISVGFGSACMTQKFIVYQIVMTAVSVIAVITRFNYFSDAFTNIWSTLFIIFGFTVQLAMTALFLLVSFSHKVTNKLINLIYKIMKKFKFIKNPEKKIERLHKEVDMFHDTNKQLFSSVKRLVVIYALVFIQVILILSIPYLIYVSFGMAPIARAAGQPTLSFYDSICI
ncbi:MAG: lysylphosphatidylglycerol synthase transmembrane domain-containing protein, partial [Ruminococcus bromii]